MTSRLALILAVVATAAGAWVLLERGSPAPSPPRNSAPPATARGQEPRLPHQLTPARLRALAERLLEVEGERSLTPPARNIFRTATRLPPELLAGAAPEPPPERPRAPAGASPGPALSFSGFVERSGPQGGVVPLAVFRFEGEVYVVGEGEAVGAYVVEKILSGEEVRLVERASGARRVFRIE